MEQMYFSIYSLKLLETQFPYYPEIPLLGGETHKTLYKNVHFTIIHNSQKVKTTPMSVSDKGVNTVWSVHEILLSHEKEHP